MDKADFPFIEGKLNFERESSLVIFLQNHFLFLLDAHFFHKFNYLHLVSLEESGEKQTIGPQNFALLYVFGKFKVWENF